MEGYDDKQDDDDGIGVVGAVAEFKQHRSSSYPQIFADTVRIASLQTFQALELGEVVNKILIYGLLIKYGNRVFFPR